ncbi:flagellar biosynthesis protein FlhA [Acetobacterium wieringae]|uniref:Flagellar biosynthesis protein FlhA n=1 Tax=Acetobacterium wieringae TaxID=52694 RepID=A0A1F2PF59_9FIRM|nr:MULTISPECIES: flagellar biosynthesis protein FlhA [Acetobacterium]OFV69997.1 flagellar biosynthesis protein FlhA [Acetobacterium wieringae]OXS25102.1 MAG: flagellar biosynthesis protein FlhA [Acetobacterium sp. MES1]URN85388.1 flagellar biosynthesis protein FlhA [Acetobacterium wieringae]UYO63814.1 flagellar biosynthesis protein FlhA [Acetobacterium wieringae]VUZ27296.1 Flagellar biosynthesis protein FlhA [Acetobacterium wieringae]
MKIIQNLVVVFVILTIALIIIPLPPFILDFMFILNISISLIILLTTMYIKGPLDFSIFPSLLLITTLLRLALNISSTRLILSNGGEAGKIIETFGSFVLGGNAVVGFIVFIIIVIVQFIVITKGAERISEVSARFTLDAMPGKQMSIDADLSSGAITDAEAKERRQKIQTEAEFYGSMDGATKLVKGDAVASMIIAVVNLVGGMIIGMVQGSMPLEEVVSVYTIATVGDGLVSQVPALMISVATAMIVTRAASENNLNVDVKNQFLSQPQVLVIAGIGIAALAFIPGAPAFQILLLAVMLSGFGLLIIRRSNVKVVVDEVEQMTQLIQEESSEVDFYRNIDNVYNIIGVEPIEMEFGYSLLPMVDEGSSGNFIDRIVIFRKQFAMDMGVVIPTVRLRDNGLINPNQYIIKIKGEEIAKGEVLVGYYLALDPTNTSEPIDGIETIEPAYGIKGKWITENEKELAEVYGYTVIDALSVIVTHMSEVIKKHMHELLSRQDINTLLENVSKANPAIVDDVIPNIISIADFQKILINLLNEGIPIRDMESILETLGDHGTSIKDTDMLTEYVRQKLKRTITRKYTDGNSIKVIALDQEIENIILNSAKKNEHGTYLAIDPQVVQTIVEKVTEQIEKLKEIIDHSIILTSPIVRIYFKRLIEQFMADLTVLSFNEIDTNIQIQVIGMIKLEN